MYFSIIKINDTEYMLERTYEKSDQMHNIKNKEYFHFARYREAKTDYWWEKEKHPEYYYKECRTDYETCKEKYDSLVIIEHEVIETNAPKTMFENFVCILKTIVDKI